MEKTILFSLSLILTLIITRIISHQLTDKKNYGTKKENSRTVTGWIRKKFGFEFHHFYLGIVAIILSLICKIFLKNNLIIIGFAIGTSLILDQLIPIMFKRKNYFKKEQITYSIILHLIAIALSFFIFSN